MSSEYTVSKQNKIRQIREKARYDKATVHAVLDAGVVAHVGFIDEGAAIVVPMLYGRDGETLYLHGARKARIIRLLEQNTQASLNVTLLDALVIARSAFHSSMNYRSVTVHGKPALVDDWDGKLQAMQVITNHTIPGRWDELRAPLDNEIKMTGIITLQIESASAKISSKTAPEDEQADYATPVWAGLLPVETRCMELCGDDRLIDGVEPSAAMRALQNRRY